MGVGPLTSFCGASSASTDAPIHELLGTYRTDFSAYAATYYGGLDSPEAFADLDEECHERGHQAFKTHGWGGSEGFHDLNREIEIAPAGRTRWRPDGPE